MKQLKNILGLLRCGLVILGVAGFALGCATRAPHKVALPVFYPPLPDAPRLQFLTSYTTAEDVGDRNRLLDFLIGRRAPSRIGKPYGIAASPGRLYVGDTSPAVVEILDLEKKKMRYFAPRGAGHFMVPGNLAIDRDGTLYVADAGRGQVLIFNSDEQFVGLIGTHQTFNMSAAPAAKASEADKANNTAEHPIDSSTPMKPTAVAIAGNRLYIADPLTHSVRVFDKNTHQQLLVIPADQKDDKMKLFSPTNLDVDQQGRVYISDIGGFRVQEFDAAGKYVQSFGRQGDRPGEFARPKGVAVDHDGRVYVVDAATQVVQIFDAEGHFLMYFGEPNDNSHTLVLPAGIAIDYENTERFQKYVAPGFQLEYLVIVVSQYGASMINVFGFIHPR